MPPILRRARPSPARSGPASCGPAAPAHPARRASPPAPRRAGRSGPALPPPPRARAAAAPAYDAFAEWYECYWSGGLSAALWAAAAPLLVPRVPPGGHALDLCCGTGVAAAALAARGFRVTGVDVSEGMLAHARRRAPGARFVAADLRRFVLPAGAAPGPADAAVCLGEGLNHLLTPGDLARAVRRVAAALRPGAAFVFDVVEESRFRAHWWGQQYTTVEADRAFAARGRYAPDTRLAHMHLEFAWREGDGAGGWRETERDLYQRCHTRDELDDALRGAGFAPDAVAYHDAARDLGLADHAGRVFVVATRSAAPVRRGAPARAAAGRRGAGPACGAPA